MTDMAQKKIRKQKWSTEESDYLKILKQQDKIDSWKEISKLIQKKFPHNSKSPKQCRQKYINYAKFSQQPLKSAWTQQQDRILANLYLQNGSCWSTFSSHLNNRAQNCIKNRFYNRLKRFAKKIDEHRLSHKQQLRGISSFQSMIRILDFSNQVKTLSFKNKLNVNTQSILYKTRVQILNYCFQYTDLDLLNCEQLCNLVKNLKLINIKIRCFGICKAKNRKNWKLSKKVLNSSLQLNLHITEDPHFDDMEIQKQAVHSKQSIQQQVSQDQNQDKSQIHKQVGQQQDANGQYNYYSPFFPLIYLQSFSYVVRPDEMNKGIDLGIGMVQQSNNSYEKTKIQQQKNQIIIKNIGQPEHKPIFPGITKKNIIIKSRADSQQDCLNKQKKN